MNSLAGHLLVATPELLDPNFARSVVLLIQHNDEGAMGLVLNRPSDMKLADVWEKVGDAPCEVDAYLNHGGPCNGPLMAIHTDEFLMEIEVAAQVYFCASPEKLQRLVLQTDQPALFFAGMAGWGPGQLEGELETGSWMTKPADADDIFGDHRDLWERATRSIVGQRFIKTLGIREVPEDPELN